MRFSFVIAAALLTVVKAHAQSVPEPSTFSGTPSAEVVLQWLHAPDPRLRAWAAHDILANKLSDLVAGLESQFERSLPDTLPDAARIFHIRSIVAMLDTLIQLDATVPATTLLRLEKLGYPTHTQELILLSRLPPEEAEPALRAFYKPSVSGGLVETRVAAQLLVQHPPAGFAAEVLSSIVVTGNIVVHDANNNGGSGWGSSSCCGVGAGNIPDDWPEAGTYSFQDPPQKGQPVPANETLFLAGSDPIYVLRTVSRRYSGSECGGLSALNDGMRSRLVGMLLRGNATSPFPEQAVYIDIPFKSRETYRAQVQAFVEEQQENFSKVAWALTKLDLLTEQERQAATLRINLTLQDTRAQPAEDLPVISFRPPVQWGSMGSLR